MTVLAKEIQLCHRGENNGFTLLEMLVSIAVLLVIAGGAFSALEKSQKVYGSQQLQSDMHAGLRGALQLMSQEIGQAGSLNLSPLTLTGNALASPLAQAVTVSSSANIFVGERLTVDTGANEEVVQVTGIPSLNAIQGIFQLNHAAPSPVVAQGAFPQGVLTTAPGNQLQIFGDINADGTLAYVEYDCNPGTANAPGTLTRSLTVLAPGVATQNQPQILLNNLLANPNNAPCFTPSMGAGGAVAPNNCSVGANAFTCVTDVQVMLTVQTAERDPQTDGFVTMTKSFLNLSSRNVFAAWFNATSASPVPNLLQPNPPGLPLQAY